jgi:hypothetical protein
MAENNSGLKQRVILEIRHFLLYFFFLALFLTAFTTYTRLILGLFAKNDIHYLHYGYDIVESLILAKILLLGEHFHLGERFANRSLIIPTLYKTLLFSLLVMIFSIAEHFIVGSLEGQSFSKLYDGFIDKGLYAILAKLLIMFFVFILFFAFIEMSRVLGESKLFNLFLRRNDSINASDK